MDKHRSLIKAIFDIYRISLTHISQRASEYGISRGQWYFLNRLLFENDGISQEQLSAEMYVDSAHTARAMKQLEDNGFIVRKPDPEDGRKKIIFVTKRSMDIKEDYHKIYKELNQVLIQGFSSEEQKTVKALLNKMRNNILSYLDSEAPDEPCRQ